MKNKRILQLLLIWMVSYSIISCTDDNDNGDPIITENESSLNIKLTQGVLPDNSQCIVYVFSKENAADPYLLKDSIHLDETYRRVMPYIPTDWSAANYRFLFISLPTDNAGITLSNHLNTDLIRDVDTWDNVRLTATDVKSISGDCYFGVLDKTGTDIGSTLLITGEIKRLVGQMVLDIYRGQTVDQPEDIQNAEVFSVIDRVEEIEVTYSGLSDVIRFDESGDIISVSTYGDTITVTYPIVTQDEFWRVPVTVADINNPFLTPAATGTAGSVRIRGIFGFPADQTVRVRAIFRYYDTTAHCDKLVHTHDRFCHERGDINRPITCTIPEHAHTRDCGYDKRSIELNLPRIVSSELLTIFPNMYTVNKAAIRYDRIIDVTRSGDLTMDLDWESN